MALFPQGLTHIDARCNTGERRLLHQLKRCLEDDYIVWHDVPIGPQARQPDFVILSPRWGVLLLEVKDWRRSSLVSATRDRVELSTDRGRITAPHPLRQARDVMLELVDLMKRDPALVHPDGPFAGRLVFPFGWGAVMSRLTREELAGSDFDEVFPPHATLLRDELDPGVDPLGFQKRLWGMFTVSYPHTLTLPQRDRIRWHLFPEVRLTTQATLRFEDAEPGSAAPPAIELPDLMTVMDLQQEQVARTLGEGHRVIHGAAGSGKTMILVFRAQVLAQAAQPGRPILVLCFNRALAGRIEAMLRERGVDERVQVRTFHAWCQDLVRSYQLSVPATASDDDHFSALAHTVERAVERGLVPGGQYVALLIDEAHDFEDGWLRLAARMVDPATNSLLVLYDDAQSIYRLSRQRRRRFSFASVGIQAQGRRTQILRLNYRNTAEVLAVALHCAAGVLDAASPGQDTAQADATAASEATDPAATVADEGVPLVPPASAGRRGPLPVLFEAAHAGAEAAWVADRVAAHLASGGRPGDVAVLARTRALMRPFERALAARGVPLQSMGQHAFRHFDWQADAVRMVTLHSAKGLEFPLVYVVGLHVLPMKDEALDEALRLLYVGMTRATRELALSAHGQSPLVQRVRQALHDVAQRLAADG